MVLQQVQFDYFRYKACYCGAPEQEHKSSYEHKNLFDNNHDIIEEEEEEDVDNKHGIIINIHKPESDQNWKSGLSIRDYPTNAFGNIEFDGSLSLGSKYVRLSVDTNLEKIKQFLVDQWEMMTPRPRLAIGIIGGAQNFKLEGRKQQTFKSGLIGALKVNI